MRKLNGDNPARLFAQLSAITSDCDPEEYPPLEYDIDGAYLRLTGGSPATGGWLLAIKTFELADDLVQYAEGSGALRRSFRLIYLAPLETYFWGEYRWRDANSMCIRACWHRIPKDYNVQLDALRKSRQRGCRDA